MWFPIWSMPCAAKIRTTVLFFFLFYFTWKRRVLPLSVVRRGQHTHCLALKCYNYPGVDFRVHSVCVITLRNRQLQTQVLVVISLMGCLLMAGYGMSTVPEQGVFEMQWLAQCPVNFNRVCNGTNQELRVGIYFKSPSLRIRGGILSGWKKAIVCGFPLIPCKSL